VIENEAVVAIARLGEPEQRLQQPVDGGRRQQVAPTSHIGHALQRVVDHHGQMIAGGEIAAFEDDVSPKLRRSDDLRWTGAFSIFAPGEGPGRFVESAPHGEPERRLVAPGEPVVRLGPGEGAARSVIEERAIGIAPTIRSAGDLRAATETGIDEAPLIKARERRGIVVAMLALAARRRKPQPKPTEVIDNRRLESRLAARAVQILQAQQHAAFHLGRQALIDQRRIGVAKMERPVWRRGEAEDGSTREDFIEHGDKAHT